MSGEVLALLLLVLFAVLFTWAFRNLPREEWQVLAALPCGKGPEGQWHARNLTYYGLLVATAQVVGVLIYLVLMVAVGVAWSHAMLGLSAILLPAMVASRWVARWVEGKRHTFTVAGAAFAGLLLAPLMLWLLGTWSSGSLSDPEAFRWLLPGLSAMAVAYAFGEGIGRLACLSFGCCYGKPLSELQGIPRLLFSGLGCTFRGKIKKITYASGLEGVPVVPVQGLSAVVLVTLGLIGLLLFCSAHFAAALLVCMLGAQLWRLLAETLRADERGPGRLTAYQRMSLIGLLVPVMVALFAPSPQLASQAMQIDLEAGLSTLWNPALILLLQGLWLAVFRYTGWSTVTESRISFHLHQDRV